MSITPEEIEFAKELFFEIDGVTTRRMMGGLCLYSHGTIFAIVHSDLGVMIKGAGDFKQELDDMGLTRWSYARPGNSKQTAMPYWQLPESALDDPHEACALARRALAHL